MSTMQNVQPPENKTFEEYHREGWRLYGSKGNHDAAEENFRRAISVNPNSVDAYYGLALVLKAQDRRKEAIAMFQKVLDLLNANVVEDRNRAQMLRRLALGHINWLQSGDWNLEREIWKHER